MQVLLGTYAYCKLFWEDALLYKERLLFWPKSNFVRLCKLKFTEIPRRMLKTRGTVTVINLFGLLGKLCLEKNINSGDFESLTVIENNCQNNSSVLY